MIGSLGSFVNEILSQSALLLRIIVSTSSVGCLDSSWMELFVRRLMFLAFQFITFFFVLSSKIQDSLPYVNIETTNAVYARIFTDKSITSSFQIRNSRPKAAWAFFILLLRFGSLSPSYLIRWLWQPSFPSLLGSRD